MKRLPHILRVTGWVIRLAFAAIAGCLFRAARRVAGKKPRVWHGVAPMHMTRDMVRADRLAGYSGGSLVADVRLNRAYSLVSVDDFDLVLEDRGFGWDEYHWATVTHFLQHADILVLFFDAHFGPRNRPETTASVLAWMRRLGIRIIFVPSGLDVVYDNGFVTRYDIIGRIRKDYPSWDLAEDRTKVERRLRLYCQNADLIVSSDSMTERFLTRTDIRFKYFPIDTDSFTPSHTSGNAIPLVVHAPNHRHIKGTEYLISAVEHLNHIGMAVELRLVEKVPPAEARRIYAQADVIADQFCIGAYGVFALEGLGLGKPVLTYLDQEHLGDPGFNLPIINANAVTLDGVLAVLLALPVLRQRIGAAGRKAVKLYHSSEAMAAVWDRIYRHVWTRSPLELSDTAYFAPGRKSRSFTEDPAREEFWPVSVDDLLSDILDTLRRVSCPV